MNTLDRTASMQMLHDAVNKLLDERLPKPPPDGEKFVLLHPTKAQPQWDYLSFEAIRRWVVWVGQPGSVKLDRRAYQHERYLRLKNS